MPARLVRGGRGKGSGTARAYPEVIGIFGIKKTGIEPEHSRLDQMQVHGYWKKNARMVAGGMSGVRGKGIHCRSR